MVMMLVLIVVMAVLLLAALFLALVVYTLDSRGNVRKQSQMPGSVKAQASYHHHQPREQHCCMCGNVRNRKFQVSEGTDFVSESERHSRSNGNLWDLLQPFFESACGKSGLRHGKPRSPKETSINRNLLENVEWSKLRDLQTKLESAVARSASSATSGYTISSSATASPTDFANNFKVDNKLASMTSTGSISPILPPSPLSFGISSLEPTLDVSLNRGIIDSTGSKKQPQRRLVLEILLSPSQAADGNTGQLQRPTGVRLKLETNTSLENLARFTAAAAATSRIERDEVQSVESMSRKDGTGGIGSTFESVTLQASDKNPQNGVCLVGTAGLAVDLTGKAAKQLIEDQKTNARLSTELHTCQDGKINANNPLALISAISQPFVGDVGPIHHVAEGEICNASSLLSTPHGTTLCGYSKPLDLKLPRASIHMAETSESTGCNIKTSSSVHICTLGDYGKEFCRNVTVQQPTTSSSALTFTALEGLGSLQIRSLEAVSKSKSYSSGGTADIASALTALTVDSVGEKSTERGVPYMGLPVNSCVKGAAAKSNCNKLFSKYVNDEEAHWEESGSEQGMDEVEEHHCLLSASGASDQVSGLISKKEKKKKKNRSKRQKAKGAVVMTTDKEVQAQQEICKSVPVSCKHNQTPNAVEVGCLCGTVKGGIHSSDCPYPFTSSGSMIQRKLKEQYDDLVRSNINKTLTLAQVGRFTTCLVDAKASLQHKSDLVQRKFTIAKSLLCKADKSSFDRLCGQIYGLEVEQRRMEEDTLVYNRLQEQLKLSPAYQKMLEYGRTHFELQPNTGQLIEKLDGEAEEMSFEELLAQEKKDSFWQKHNPSRSSVQVI
ncbi:hypothetical protein O6H91_04G077400 [Diphasiastrum complanatum]|uniref:Uncharacterized protein n=1 Tax=Diphasiastrum complanatum TaxID=34168 RepID=A0ACC2DYL6_DIPCM|nr:hypothetical protein O6H91_04G077400 [Diphasiastrum complanatum]